MNNILIFLLLVLKASTGCFSADSDTIYTPNESKFEWFPLIAYDRDIGLGLGVKGFYLNAMKKSESTDLTLFASTKGERWVRFVFSYPDIELRHHKKYDFAVDLTVDYDLYIRNNFFGVGPNSQFNSRTYYSKEPLDINLTLSRGFTNEFVVKMGIRYKRVNNYNIDKGIYSNPELSVLKSGPASAASFFLNLILDKKDSKMSPHNGFSLEADWENIPLDLNNGLKYSHFLLEIQYYLPVEMLKSVIATRFKTEWLTNNEIPVHFMLSLGGNSTLRGYPQDRFLDKASSLLNTEFRLPIRGRLGAVLGLDIGRVWPSLEKYNFSNWKMNYVTGLRYYMDTFIIRVDLGFSNEFTGVNFNINHIF
jgi:outer membrane protein assembly factor BamA